MYTILYTINNQKDIWNIGAFENPPTKEEIEKYLNFIRKTDGVNHVKFIDVIDNNIK